ncbi:MAG: hypothetical protein EBZ45_05270, partial [Actinobacteria bacterium]|nr:hypothetical protein [Actinomycetota bacterium]
MYAVIATGGKQEKVTKGQQVQVELLGAADGSEVKFTPVLVVDGSTSPPIDVIREETGGTAEVWVCGRGQHAPKQSKPCTHDIRLHRESMKEYDPDKISALLDRELNRIVTDIEGKNIGLVFGETSS